MSLKKSQSPPSFSPTRANPTRNLNPPKTFQSAIYARLDNPLASLFRLGIRVLELIFALASGISYAVELSQHHRTAPPFIYSQVVFGLTLVTLVIDAVTLRSYRLTFLVESVLCVLWLALFGVFYEIYFDGQVDAKREYLGVDMKRMKRAVWVDLINFLLWMSSALFSTMMCCSGVKAVIKAKMERRRRRKEMKCGVSDGEMEEGVVSEGSRYRDGDRLPLYEEIAALARSE